MTAEQFEAELAHWSDDLAQRLAAARDAADTRDRDAIRAAAARLRSYITENPKPQADLPQTKVFDEMDAIALRAHNTLLLGEIDRAVAEIAVNSAELTALAKRVSTQTEANQQAAKFVRLEAAKKVLSSLTETINAAKSLKAELEKPGAEQDFSALATQIDKALKSLQDLHGAVAKGT